MGIKDLIPWNNGGREVGVHRGTDVNPFFTLHREMNRMFDDVFRGFDLAPLGSPGD
jgi:HSP20 family protein